MSFFQNKKTKKFLFYRLISLSVILLLFFLLNIDSSCAQDAAAKENYTWYQRLGNGFLIAFNTILYGIFQLSTNFFSLAIWLLNLMLSADVYDKVFFSPTAIEAIKETWKVVRDFFNMFFMLVIILIAIGTILRVQRFSDKKMILNVVLAALLVNFSLPITLFIIDISQLAMTFFMNGINYEGKEFANQISNLINLSSIWNAEFKDSVGYIVALIFAIIFILVIAFMMILLAVALLIRMIAYWVLLILSPLAMFGIALKGTGLGLEKATSNWFQKISYYSFFGPVMLFFLWIATHLIKTISSLNKEFSKTNGVQSITTAGLDDKTVKIVLAIFGEIIPYIVTIYLLYYGYDLAQKMSTGATKSLMDWGSKKMSQWGKTWGRRAGYGAAAIGTLGAVPLVRNQVLPRAGGAWEGFRNRDRRWYNPIGLLRSEGRQEELRKERRGQAAAFGGGRETADRYRQRRVNERIKELRDANTNVTPEMLENRDRTLAEAAAMILAQDGRLGNVNDYNRAFGVLRGNRTSEMRLEREVSKINFIPALQHNIGEAINVLNRNDEAEILLVSRQNEALRLLIQRLQRTGTAINTDQERIQALRDYFNHNARLVNPDDVFEERIRTMGVVGLSKQRPEILNNNFVQGAMGRVGAGFTPEVRDANRTAAINADASANAIHAFQNAQYI